MLYLAPTLLGDGARGLFHLPGLDRMDQQVRLEILDVRAVGRDWRITARPIVQSAAASARTSDTGTDTEQRR